MIANSIFLASLVCMAAAMYVLSALSFLAPYRELILYKYGPPITAFAVLVFLNVFAAVYVATRKVFLKDTGKKLAHIEKQLRTGSSISDELSRRLDG
jgi:hypothetical protein